MRKLELIQGTAPWLEWRKKIITSSDTGVIMELSPYMTRRELYYEKKDCWPPELIRPNKEFIFAKGHQFEASARAEYCKDKHIEFIPACIESECGRFGTSLDGYFEEEGRGVEIKFMGVTDLEELIMHDKLAAHYYVQCQWHCFVANLESVDLIAGNNERFYITNIKRSDADIKLIKQKAIEFHGMLEREEMPEICDRDKSIIDIDQTQYMGILKLRQNVDTIKKQLAQAEELLKAQVKEVSKNIKTKEGICGNLKFLKVEQQGQINYKAAIPEGIDVEKFRKPSTYYWKCSIVGEL